MPVAQKIGPATKAQWQFAQTPLMEWPAWVINVTTERMGELFVRRRSGDQLVNLGDWLLLYHDRMDPDHITNEQYRREYVEIEA